MTTIEDRQAVTGAKRYEMSELSDKEKKITKVVVWIWRNLLASGVFIALFWVGYNWVGNKFDGMEAKIDNVEHEVIRVGTVVKERIRVDRGDYGWAEPAFEPDDLFTEEPSEEKIEEGIKIREHINEFADE
jgi:hypothetical protein